MVTQNLMKMVAHHLNEANGWAQLRKNSSDVFSWNYCARKEIAHHEMMVYFYYLLKDVHYVKGTWRQVWGHRK